ncbi:isoprenylcysteine carboxylmethyltransferase family protein [Novosphingobium profundi]|uniref:methanethiol S-methyltransferase n=1 Tax=Novosphingobium profundi TaxID=1774954 RepID=UPI001FE6E8D5|nr:methanethiol S-methyltransferase [Novosphingobium profundi]MBT0667687.1 isoprenylcysteine carboxylmethyltransferase family protein [Novosphingobium profundi]
MMRAVAAAYALFAYVLFLGTVLYAVGFVGNWVVPRTIDSGPVGALVPSLAIDLGLLGLFAVQHSLMARPFFKRWWTRIVPAPLERSTYVLLASLALDLLFWQWRPLPAPIWAVSGALAGALTGLMLLGWVVVLISTFLISHFELFGLAQVWRHLNQRPIPAPSMMTPLFYGFVRHPIYLGFMIAFWATPTMTLGHLVFAIMTTLYILVAIQFEEHDLVVLFGERYLAYRRRVSMIVPLPPRGP